MGWSPGYSVYVSPFTSVGLFICGGPEMAPALPPAADARFGPPHSPRPRTLVSAPRTPPGRGRSFRPPALPQAADARFGTPHSPFRRLDSWSRDPGHRVDLDVDALAGRRGLDGGAGRLHTLEVLL